MESEKTLLITGATATGKSELAMGLARELNMGILSADSMQVYRHLDIASAKPTLDEQRLVPHACIDLVEPTENFSVAQWLREADKVFNANPAKWIVAGGSGLYIKAFLHGLDKLPESPPDLRRKWEEIGHKGAVEQLIKRDSTLAAKIDLNNPRRVVRALVLLDQGMRLPRSSFTLPKRNVIHIHLQRKPEDLRKRIIDRTDKMFERGLLDEFRSLLDIGLRRQNTAWQAIGMDCLLSLCEGRISIREAKDSIVCKTWRFSRHQQTWFQKFTDLHVINIEKSWDSEKILKMAKKMIFL